MEPLGISMNMMVEKKSMKHIGLGADSISYGTPMTLSQKMSLATKCFGINEWLPITKTYVRMTSLFRSL